MMVDSIKQIFERDLNKLKTELDAYNNEEQLWLLAGDIKNSAGNLILHICGNVQHFVGSVLGETGYIRQRDLEFNEQNVSREEMHRRIDATLSAVNHTFSTMSEDHLEEKYPVDVFGSEMSNGFFMIHLIGHLEYHMGQVNYHRRLLTN